MNKAHQKTFAVFLTVYFFGDKTTSYGNKYVRIYKGAVRNVNIFTKN